VTFFKSLSAADLQAVLDFDYREHVLTHQANRNRFYLYLLPNGDDLQIHTVACQAPSRWKTAVAKEVIRASVDQASMVMKDVAFCGMSGYQVDWSPEGGRSRQWSYEGQWSKEIYQRRGMWKIHGRIVNPEAIQAHPRFQYCAYTEACGHPLDWLKSYAAHPRIELLAKAGAGRFGSKTGFVSQLERNKGLMRYFMEHLEEIKTGLYGVPEILRAYRKNVSIYQAKQSIGNRRRMGDQGLPKEVDADRATEYACRPGIGEWSYCHYVQDCQTLGLDLRDTKVVFPRHFKQRRQIVADQVAEQRRRKQVETARLMDQQIRTVAEQYAKLERIRAGFLIQIPRRAKDFILEGKRLRNCLGDGHYAAKMSRGETLLAFVRRARRPSESFVAVEWSPDQKRILQCYGARNEKPAQPVLDFVNKAFKALKRRAA